MRSGLNLNTGSVIKMIFKVIKLERIQKESTRKKTRKAKELIFWTLQNLGIKVAEKQQAMEAEKGHLDSHTSLLKGMCRKCFKGERATL